MESGLLAIILSFFVCLNFGINMAEAYDGTTPFNKLMGEANWPIWRMQLQMQMKVFFEAFLMRFKQTSEMSTEEYYRKYTDMMSRLTALRCDVSDDIKLAFFVEGQDCLTSMK